MSPKDEWETLAADRDKRIVTAPPGEATTMMGLVVWTKNALMAVAGEGVDVDSLVQFSRRGTVRTLVCGERSGSQFVRKDGVCCNFKVVVRESEKALALDSYVLHLDVPENNEGCPRVPPFLRWEYSPERKENVTAVKEPLAHLHPGHDHIRLPSPVLSPKELIAVFLSLDLWQ